MHKEIDAIAFFGQTLKCFKLFEIAEIFAIAFEWCQQAQHLEHSGYFMYRLTLHSSSKVCLCL
jgi:hypothetical protein